MLGSPRSPTACPSLTMTTTLLFPNHYADVHDNHFFASFYRFIAYMCVPMHSCLIWSVFEIYVKGVVLSLLTIMLVRVPRVIMQRNSLSVLLPYGSAFVNIPQLLHHSFPNEHLHSFHGAVTYSAARSIIVSSHNTWAHFSGGDPWEWNCWVTGHMYFHLY